MRVWLQSSLWHRLRALAQENGHAAAVIPRRRSNPRLLRANNPQEHAEAHSLKGVVG